jgi:hypothetical protein
LGGYSDDVPLAPRATQAVSPKCRRANASTHFSSRRAEGTHSPESVLRFVKEITRGIADELPHPTIQALTIEPEQQVESHFVRAERAKLRLLVLILIVLVNLWKNPGLPDVAEELVAGEHGLGCPSMQEAGPNFATSARFTSRTAKKERFFAKSGLRVAQYSTPDYMIDCLCR